MAKHHDQLKEQLKQFLQQPYDGADAFLENVIYPVFGRDNFEDYGNLNVLAKRPDLAPKAEATGINAIRHIGGLYVEGSQLDIFDITLDFKKQLQRNRVEVQQIVRSIISSYSGAFIIFHYGSGARWEWRFTFFHKGASATDSTDAKRYTFLLGPGQSCRTAAENFVKIFEKIDSEGEFEMDDIVRAFDVEALSKEFFGKYKAQYEKFCQFVYEHKTDRQWFGPEFESWADKRIRDYVKRMLGRIVFLHFLQKKGWLGVPADKAWGEGDVQFMKHLFDQATPDQQADYLNAVLEPMFSDLDTLRNKDIAGAWCNHLLANGGRTGGSFKVPYLNGGLFERDEMDTPRSVFPADYFRDLFDFFYQYNFTIDENDPDDAQVGVDPEMLGRIFENLLEDNKDKGAFYTPKEIVQYMCRESLIAYLQTDLTDEPTREALRLFVTSYDAAVLGGASSALALQVSEQLKAVKICDPAIGSGAFPMGLLRELFLCRSAIEGFDRKQAADIKRHIIQQNIYGVDIEKGAVDIARLRFWLTLILDEETPHALPNLDFKIMQGNSLLEQYQGIDLTVVAKTKTERRKRKLGDMQLTWFEADIDVTRNQLKEMMKEYYSCEDHARRSTLRDAMAANVKSQIQSLNGALDLSSINVAANSDFFLWHTWFADVFEEGGFDIVIGNPPYIQLQKDGGFLAELYKPCGFKTFDRMGDIYSLFYEHGNNLLREGGVLCYITSNKWMRTGYGEKTRVYFKDVVNPRILIDFVRMKLFDDATVETNILLFAKEEYKASTMCISLVEIKKEQLVNLNGLIKDNAYWNRFDSSEFWTLSDVATGMLKNKIKASGQPLKKWGLKVNFGIKTGFNDAFIISTEKKNEILAACQTEEERARTADILRPVIRGKDVGVYLNKWAGFWLICTFPAKKYKISSYPALRNYLLTFGKERLEQSGKKYEDFSARKKTRNDWFETQDSIAYWEELEKPKIIWKRIGSILRFAYDEDNSMCLDSTCFATGEYVKFLCAVFNSKLGHFMLQDSPKTGTGDLLVSVQAIEPIVVPHPTAQVRGSIETLVDEILSAKKVIPRADTSALEAEIDRLVYALYDLTPDEIAIVEGQK